MLIKDIKIGANLEISLFREDGKPQKSYPVKVQNIYADKRMEIDVPFSAGQIVLFQINNIIEVVTINKEGIFSFKAKITDRMKRHNMPVLVIEPETELEKKQRRAFYRLTYSCNVRYRKYKLPVFGENNTEFKTSTTFDISGGGICMMIEEKLDLNNNDYYECVIILDKGIEITAVCKPVNIKKEDTDKYWKLGMKFERITEQAREKIINFIFQAQLKLRRKGLV